MRAAVITQFNHPWELKEMPDPRPAGGQVVIRIEASGLCGTDLHVHRGHLPSVRVPIVAGHEPVGTIVEVGAGVTRLRVGDRVGVSWEQKGCGRCHECQSGRLYGCARPCSWTSLGGGNSELMVAWAEGCTLVPEGLSATAAAPLFCAGYTVMSGLRTARPLPGERVAVLGVGGLGHLAVQIAKAFGHEVIALTSREDKRAEAHQLGADEALLIDDDPGKALRDAGGADVLVSTTNSARQISRAFAGLRRGGRLVNVGIPDGPFQTDFFTLMFPPKQLLGASQFQRSDLVDTLALAAAGKIKPIIEEYPITRINQTLDRLAAGEVRYRAVLHH